MLETTAVFKMFIVNGNFLVATLAVAAALLIYAGKGLEGNWCSIVTKSVCISLNFEGIIAADL